MKPIYINGHQVDYFDYDEGNEELVAVNASGKTIATFAMARKQWNKLKTSRSGWKKLGILFGDEEN